MKKIFACILSVCPMVASADYLDDKIANLTKQKLDKIAKLEECQKNTKGLKIAGITTLGVSAIGIGANIGEAVALKKYDEKIATAEQSKSDLDKEIRRVNAEINEKTVQVNPINNNGGGNNNGGNNNGGNNNVISPLANTCGSQQCVMSKTDWLATMAPGAVDGVCVNNIWYPSACKTGYQGTPETCTLNGQTINYVLHCAPVAKPENPINNNTCGDVNECDEGAKAAYIASIPGAESATCVNGQWKVATCKDVQTNNASKKTCVRDDNVFPYFDYCDVVQDDKPVRKNNDMCTDTETKAIMGAAQSWWQNGKCVAKSCRDNFYLAIENGVSKGHCVSACSAYQIVENWPAGGKACDTAKKYVAPTVNCERKVFESSEYTAGMCYGKCEGYAYENNCKLTGDPIENEQTGQCICNPVPSDLRKPKVEVQLPSCPESESVQDTEAACNAHCTGYAADKKCQLVRGTIYYADTKQCFCNALAPRKRVEEKKNPCPETTIVSMSASNCTALCNGFAAEHSCLIESTSHDGVNCHCNPANTEPVKDWDLTSKVSAPVVETKPEVRWPACNEHESEKDSKSACDKYCDEFADSNRCELTRDNVYYADTKQCFCSALSPRKRVEEKKNPCPETPLFSMSASNCPSLCSGFAVKNGCEIINTSHDGVNCYCNPEGAKPIVSHDLISGVTAKPKQKPAVENKPETKPEQTPCAAYEQNAMVPDTCAQICSQHAQKNNCILTSTAWNNGVCYCNSAGGQNNKPAWSLF